MWFSQFIFKIILLYLCSENCINTVNSFFMGSSLCYSCAFNFRVFMFTHLFCAGELKCIFRLNCKVFLNYCNIFVCYAYGRNLKALNDYVMFISLDRLRCKLQLIMYIKTIYSIDVVTFKLLAKIGVLI